MNLITIILILLVVLFFYVKIYRSMKKHTAAMNALVAKATYLRLSESSQKEIENRAISILEQGWKFSKEDAREWLNHRSESERYGFLALAMLELNIKPISDNWRWQIVRNPFLALIKADSQIEVAKHSLHREGIEVDLNNGKKGQGDSAN